jgi:TRAP-type uncharacterized transport system substrate-binding protein
MLGFNRWHLFIGSAAILCIGGIVSLALIYLFPAPPSKLLITGSFQGSYYNVVAAHYKEIFARHHVTLEPRMTKGSVDNLRLLQDSTSGFQLGIMQGGVSDGKHAPELLSLGRINDQVFWLFYRSTETLDDLTQLKGKRIVVGGEGSSTRLVGEKVLAIAGVTAKTATLLPLAAQAAVDALNDGRVDVIWIAFPPEAPIIQSLLRDPKVRSFDFAKAEALTRIFPYLVRLVLPRGVIDYENHIPSADLTVIATTNGVVVRKETHPAIIDLLLQTMLEEHAGASIMHPAGYFPTQTDPEYPMAQRALDFYKDGPSFLNRYLPFWMTSYAKRTLAVLVAVFAITIPLFNLAPKLYMWFVRQFVTKTYRRLRIIEKTLQTGLTAPQVVELQADLENIDRAARILPMRHSDLFFAMRLHIDLIRTQLALRLIEARSQTQVAKVA